MIEISMETVAPGGLDVEGAIGRAGQFAFCLLYTSDAADE